MRNVARTRRMGRILGVAVAAGAIALIAGSATISGAATPAVGTVAPAGPITVKITNGVFHLSVSGTMNDIGGLTGTLEGTVDADGTMTFPKAGISLPAYSVSIILPAVITPVVTGDWHGTIDPAQHTISLSGPMKLQLNADGTPITDCPLGPFTVHAQGSNYQAATGGAAVADPAFQIPAVTPGTAGCGGAEDTLSSALGLPGPGAVDMHLAVTPHLTGSGTPPPSTTTFTTTTQAPTTTTTVAPLGGSTTPVAANGTTLPRTGGSSSRLALLGLTLVGAGTALAMRRRRALG